MPWRQPSHLNGACFARERAYSTDGLHSDYDSVRRIQRMRDFNGVARGPPKMAARISVLTNRNCSCVNIRTSRFVSVIIFLLGLGSKNHFWVAKKLLRGAVLPPLAVGR